MYPKWIQEKMSMHIDIDLPAMNKNDISIDMHEDSTSILDERKIK